MTHDISSTSERLEWIWLLLKHERVTGPDVFAPEACAAGSFLASTRGATATRGGAEAAAARGSKTT